MDAKIVQYNLYHGNPSLGDRGYLGYGFHNQYMETWVQAGLPALAAGFGCWHGDGAGVFRTAGDIL
jgi:O-antigen ligase